MDNKHIKRCSTSLIIQFSSLQLLSCVWLFAPHWLQHVRPPCPSPTPRVYSNSCPLGQRCHATISSYVVPFSSCLQFFPASGSLPMSQLFTSGGQSIGAWASTSVLPVNIQELHLLRCKWFRWWDPGFWTDAVMWWERNPGKERTFFCCCCFLFSFGRGMNCWGP